jgi:hypothetical protein
MSRQTKTWLAAQPAGRFEFIFTPKHGSWLNLVDHHGGIDDVNRYPVVHTWFYKLAEAA